MRMCSKSAPPTPPLNIEISDIRSEVLPIYYSLVPRTLPACLTPSPGISHQMSSSSPLVMGSSSFPPACALSCPACYPYYCQSHHSDHSAHLCSIPLHLATTMPCFQRCCCCVNLRTGGLMMGVMTLALSVFSIVPMALSLNNRCVSTQVTYSHETSCSCRLLGRMIQC